jgi:hypothetical protein
MKNIVILYNQSEEGKMNKYSKLAPVNSAESNMKQTEPIKNSLMNTFQHWKTNKAL